MKTNKQIAKEILKEIEYWNDALNYTESKYDTLRVIEKKQYANGLLTAWKRELEFLSDERLCDYGNQELGIYRNILDEEIQDLKQAIKLLEG